MDINGVYALPLELKFDEKDEIAVRWDDEDEEYCILTRNGQQEEFLHEDGTWRKPNPFALADAWATVKSMNRRVNEGRNRRK